MALVIPSLAGLLEKAATGLFKTFVPAWSSLGYSGNEMIAAFREAGGAIRRTDALQAIRTVLGKFKYQNQIEAAPAEGPLNRKWITDTDAALSGNYQVFGIAVYKDKVTGEERSTRISFFSDENLGKQGWADQFIDGFGRFDYSPFYDVASLSITGAIHQAKTPF